MTIPQAAIDAAAERFDAGPGFDVSILARYALEAAMPHLRKQIAEEIRAHIPSPLEPRATQAESLIDVGIYQAARIAETGAEQ